MLSVAVVRGSERLAELVTVRGAEVDFVTRVVQAEADGAGRLAAVEVIDKQCLDFLDHEMITIPSGEGKPVTAAAPDLFRGESSLHPDDPAGSQCLRRRPGRIVTYTGCGTQALSTQPGAAGTRTTSRRTRKRRLADRWNCALSPAEADHATKAAAAVRTCRFSVAHTRVRPRFRYRGDRPVLCDGDRRSHSSSQHERAFVQGWSTRLYA